MDMTINQLIEYAKSQNCSDIHITQEGEIALRRYGVLGKIDQKYSPDDLDELIFSMFSDKQAKKYREETADIDFSYQTPSGIRCRVNAFHQRGTHAATLRIMGNSVPTFETLHLPPSIKTFADLPRGLVLVTGPTGSGKSTTLASMIDYINRSRAEHIVTIEDPIEYMYTPGKSTIHQREIGRDVDTFSGALRSVLREDPDVILVGEMRDFETISAAITAAETGHLVMSTLHTTGAAETIDRIIDVFPPHAQNQIRTQLAAVLMGVVTQTLIPYATGDGRAVATEVLVCNDAINNLIRSNKTYQIESHMQTSSKSGMHTLNSDLKRLVQSGAITRDIAIKRSNNPEELKKLI
ncbi:MAG: type IV pilus twitching motility protein PilT [Lachnospiraceae bacterium]|nr:type IV pilus twitching motility protein PilT [Lachnospiraceae bacterium]MBQ3968641.1 type IV pilus twitching motility protein PilT [Lachnospiraceae bacterium]MBR4587026.1 type IV pilus twitching motility protein PilT [Lachnospiraceae bacterium]